MTTVLSADEVRRGLVPIQVIAALEAAFRDRFTEIAAPPRTQMKLADGIFLIMPCYDRAGRTLGMKLITVRDLPAGSADRIRATYLLLDPITTEPRLVLDAGYLTDLRTAATSAVATKFLAREDAKTLGIFGTGRQAQAHARVLPLVRHFERIYVCGRNPSQGEDFVQAMSREVAVPLSATTHDQCAACDVICTCTTSATPLFDGNVLRSGTHLNLVGAFQPHTREVDSITMRRARIYVDTYEGALAEAGDLLIPMKEAVITRDDIAADLHELIAGKKPGRVSASDITVFKSVGCALEDLAAAELLPKKVAIR